MVFGKMPPGKKSTRKKDPEKIAPQKISPGNIPPGKMCPGKLPPRRMLPPKFAPPPTPNNSPPPPPKKKGLTRFLLLLTLSYRCSFFLQIFMVTSFRGESRSPATSIIDLLVTVVNDINYCHKNLLFRGCRAHRFASEFIR